MIEKQRLFFALWPDDIVRRQIAGVLDILPSRSGKPVPFANWHVTLAFLNGVTIPTRQCAEGVAARLRCPPFVLCLDQLGFWSRSGILWLGASVVPPTLVRLAAELNDGLKCCGIKTDPRPYRPHISLLRSVIVRAKAFPVIVPINWSIDQLVLVESRLQPQGSRYHILQSWPLIAT